MFLKPLNEINTLLVHRAKKLGGDCKRVFVAGSGGADSTVVATILCQAFGPENVVVLYRDIRSKPQHQADVEALQKVLGFKFIFIDGNPIYDLFLEQCRKQFEAIGLDWHEENSPLAGPAGFTMAYGSLKSVLTTPMASFISKAVDSGAGRIFGTGNAEEDGLLRYYDKRGDGAVDNNIIDGLTKMEVRQLLIHFAEVYNNDIFSRIAHKTPSADLEACGDLHNDEDQLSSWAQKMGFNIRLSYGDCQVEGNIAWALKQDMDHGVITGANSGMSSEYLKHFYNYTNEECELIMFLRLMEEKTRHKVDPIPGLNRKTLRGIGLVD